MAWIGGDEARPDYFVTLNGLDKVVVPAARRVASPAGACYISLRISDVHSTGPAAQRGEGPARSSSSAPLSNGRVLPPRAAEEQTMSTLKELEQLLASGRIGRREFMTRASALGLATAMSPALLITPARASTPKRGGRFRMATNDGDPADTLDPALALTGHSIYVQMQLRNCLVEVDHKSQAIPELAESYEPSPDAKQWTFELRKGVEFHNGKTLDAEDVIYSINHHRGEDTKSGEKANLEQVVDVKADGKHTVVFTLAGGNADFPYVLTAWGLPIVPNGSDPTTGWGPEATSWSPGSRASPR